MSTAEKFFEEPSIEELLDDPILHAVLERDGLTIDDVRAVIDTYQQNIQHGESLTH
ncbi:hypothetical protein GUA87_16885 [Sneathiella sp. P13V-1]|uniref:hypothetical protein n=1 Tax=Sneathiella sp. P13V-1 TaxID=2697366 RepID=UPI00187B2411|nr:hypothetical protein [Sneathiella sp. P13V-1]MBE7638535.1 hypothetical protein [Sneathiella sp. P13V-1]